MTENTESAGMGVVPGSEAGRERRRVVVLKGEGCCEDADALLHSASGAPLLEAIETALAGREFGVSVRVSEDILAKLDVLVEAGICESRSAAATFLIREGVEANAELFQAVEATSRRIADLKAALRERVTALGKQTEAAGG